MVVEDLKKLMFSKTQVEIYRTKNDKFIFSGDIDKLDTKILQMTVASAVPQKSNTGAYLEIYVI